MTTPTTLPMTDSTARPSRLLVTALVVGLAGDILLRGGEWRTGFAIWIALVAVAALSLGTEDRERRWMIGATAVAALGLVLRDAEFLMVVDLLSVLCMGALVVWHGTGKRIADLSVVQAIRAAVGAVLTAVVGAGGPVREQLAAEGASAETGRRAWAIALGVVLAVPPLFIVGALLGASDDVFAGFLERALDFLSRRAVQHTLVVAVIAWASAGWLRGATGGSVGVRVVEPVSPGAPFLTLSVGLYGMIALLALYLGTQARVLFGGEAYLQAAAGLTRAAYARDGFFEMVAASGFVLGTLVVGEWLLTRDDEAGQRRFRTAGLVLVLQVVAILVSALSRMALYVAEFGLTVDRAMSLAIMTWVFATLVTFALTTLRGRPARFAPVLLGVTIAWVAALNAANPEAIVVRVNVARAAEGKPFDAKYHANLSDDALGAILATAPRLAPADCAALREALGAEGAAVPRAATETDWRASNLPRRRTARWRAEGAPFTACAPVPTADAAR